MAVTEQQRHQLYNHLEEVLGVEDATVLMQHLHPGGHDQVATKGDVVALKSDIAAVKNDIVAVKSDIVAAKADIVALVEHKIDARIERAQVELTVRLVMFMFTLLTMQTAVLGLLRAG